MSALNENRGLRINNERAENIYKNYIITSIQNIPKGEQRAEKFKIIFRKNKIKIDE